MTNPSKAWAMMTARGVQYSGVLGGIPDLTPAEIARMLDGLPKGPFLAAMVKECGDVSRLHDLERWLWIETLRLADPCYITPSGKFVYLKQRAWPHDRGQAYCRRLAGLAVFEFLLPKPAKCDHCKGRGWVVAAGQGVSCPNCGSAEEGGTGGQSLSPEMRAELAGIPVRSWLARDDGWAARYERVHAAVCGWHQDALRHVGRALRAHEFDDVDVDEMPAS